MFDLGWSELLVIGIVALIVVGPKDLPVMFRRLGEFTGKARRMAREFQSAMNDAARDSGVEDVSRDLRKIANPKKFGMDAIKSATDDLTSWHPEDDVAPGSAKTPLTPERVVPKAGPPAGAVTDPADPVPDPGAPEPASADKA